MATAARLGQAASTATLCLRPRICTQRPNQRSLVVQATASPVHEGATLPEGLPRVPAQQQVGLGLPQQQHQQQPYGQQAGMRGMRYRPTRRYKTFRRDRSPTTETPPGQELAALVGTAPAAQGQQEHTQHEQVSSPARHPQHQRHSQPAKHQPKQQVEQHAAVPARAAAPQAPVASRGVPGAAPARHDPLNPVKAAAAAKVEEAALAAALEPVPDLTAKPSRHQAVRAASVGGALCSWEEAALRLPAVGRDLVALPLHQGFEVMLELRHRYDDNQWRTLLSTGVMAVLCARLREEAGTLALHRLASALECCLQMDFNPGTAVLRPVAVDVHPQLSLAPLGVLSSLARCLAHFRAPTDGPSWGTDLLRTATARIADLEPAPAARILWAAAALGARVSPRSLAPLLMVIQAGLDTLFESDLSAAVWGAAVLGIDLAGAGQPGAACMPARGILHAALGTATGGLHAAAAQAGGAGMQAGAGGRAGIMEVMDGPAALALLQALAQQGQSADSSTLAAFGSVTDAIAQHVTELSARQTAEALLAIARLAAAPGIALTVDEAAVRSLLAHAKKQSRGMGPHELCVLLRACQRLGLHPGAQLLALCHQAMRREWSRFTPRQAATVSRCLHALEAKPFTAQLQAGQ